MSTSVEDDSNKYNSITGIVYEFQQHSSQECRQAHHKLDTQYAEIITEVQDILTAKDGDIPTLVSNRVIEQMSDDTATRIKFRELYKSSAITMKWHTHSPASLCRLSNSKYAFNDAIKTGNDCLRVKININGLFFMPDFSPSNIEHISDRPFEVAPATPTGTATQQPPITPEQVFQTFIEQLSGSRAVTHTRPDDYDGGNQTQATGGAINPDNLPPDVRARYQKGQQHGIVLTKQDRTRFSLTDATGNTRSANHYMDGPHRLINRSGDLYYFSKWDEKHQKTFISRAPKPISKIHTPSIIRDWYMKFHAHARAYGI